MKYKIWTFTLSVLFVLNGCGGGGEDWASKDPSAIAVSTNSFDIAAGWKQLLQKGYTKTLNFSQPRSTCDGELLILQAPRDPNDATSPDYFYKYTKTINENYAGCANNASFGTKASTETFWLSAQYRNTVSGIGNRSGYWDETSPLPSSAYVGNEGALGQYTYFNDLTGEMLGLDKWMYAIEKDTATTAVYRLTISAYDANNQWIGTEENFFRIGPDNSLTLRSVTKRYRSGFHLEAT